MFGLGKKICAFFAVSRSPRSRRFARRTAPTDSCSPPGRPPPDRPAPAAARGGRIRRPQRLHVTTCERRRCGTSCRRPHAEHCRIREPFTLPAMMEPKSRLIVVPFPISADSPDPTTGCPATDSVSRGGPPAGTYHRRPVPSTPPSHLSFPAPRTAVRGWQGCCLSSGKQGRSQR